MTKQSANPRRYSRGESLDPEQPISVYLALKISDNDLENTLGRIEYLAEQHPLAIISFASYHQEEKEIVITLGVNMGPARQALRGLSIELSAGYNFLWDIQKVLFYSNPVFCAPPNQKEQEDVSNILGLPSLKQKNESINN